MRFTMYAFYQASCYTEKNLNAKILISKSSIFKYFIKK